ncbi:MAG: rRNA pseudouridine synthase [Candidatus Moraniibacteriota bacterium]|nr:MAG: rRNA pseudouridine synthase [Candidatus Moranbacteria bacterium]
MACSGNYGRTNPLPVRINRYLALRGLTTRKAADGLIAAGRVFVNGQLATLGMRVNAEDQIEVRGEARSKPYRYIVYYKPRGIITHSPVKREKSIADIYPEKGVFPIGRLDKASEGLMLLTDDGRVTERLLHPRFVHEKEYEVTLQETVASGIEEKLVRGIESEGERLQAKRVKVLNRSELSIVLTEGKKHQIRRMLSALHLTVKALKRVRIMDLRIGSLIPGEGRQLTRPEAAAFLAALGIPEAGTRR